MIYFCLGIVCSFCGNVVADVLTIFGDLFVTYTHTAYININIYIYTYNNIYTYIYMIFIHMYI